MALIQFVTEEAVSGSGAIWSALSALGTIGAALTALWLGLRDSRVRKRLADRRRLVAEALTASHLRALYDVLGRVAAGPAISAGAWDAASTPKIIATARSIEPICLDIEKNLHDLGDEVMHEVAGLVAAARDSGRRVRDIERFLPGLTPGLADHITDNVHADISRLLDREGEVMAQVGAEANPNRVRLPRQDVRIHEKSGNGQKVINYKLPSSPGQVDW